MGFFVPRFSGKRVALAAFSLLLPVLAPLSAQAQSFIGIAQLPPLGGITSQTMTSQGYGVGPNGMIVGRSNLASGSMRATLWTYSLNSPNLITQSLELTLPSGYQSTVAYAININGRRIVGAASNGVNVHAFGWDLDNRIDPWGWPNPFKPFKIHPTDGYENSIARAVTDYTLDEYHTVGTPFYKIGTRYGNFYGGTYSQSGLGTQPFGGSWRTPLTGMTAIQDYDIKSNAIYSYSSDVGRMAYADVNGAVGPTSAGDTFVGAMWNTPGNTRAYCRYWAPLWKYDPHIQPKPQPNNEVIPLYSWDMIAGDVLSEATCISQDSAGGLEDYNVVKNKTVAGWMWMNNQMRGFIWTKQGGRPENTGWPTPGGAPTLTTLPTLGGNTIPYAIRRTWAFGTIMVVGSSEVNGVPHAFFCYNGVMRDMNSYLIPNSGWVLKEARACFEIGTGTWLITGTATLKVNGVPTERGFVAAFTGFPV